MSQNVNYSFLLIDNRTSIARIRVVKVFSTYKNLYPSVYENKMIHVTEIGVSSELASKLYEFEDEIITE